MSKADPLAKDYMIFQSGTDRATRGTPVGKRGLGPCCFVKCAARLLPASKGRNSRGDSHLVEDCETRRAHVEIMLF